MSLDLVWRLLHHFFAFSFVGTLVLADWNGRAARASQDWDQRATLFGIIHLSTRVAGLGSLILLGVFGNLLSVALQYRMNTHDWLRWANGLWLVAVLMMIFVNLPAGARLASLARAGAQGGATDGFEQALKRWRLGNVALSVLYLALLCVMVFRWGR